MKIFRIALVVLTVSLAGCATDPVSITYYLLAPPDSGTLNTGMRTSKPTVVIENVEVAEFLRQSGLLIQSGNNQLSASRNHLWAESLDKAVPKALIQDLQKRSTEFDFYIRFSDFLTRTDYRLRLQIDNMQANDQGEVITSGRYQLIPTNNNNESYVAEFYFKRDLEEDGFAHAVAQMHIMVGQLADSILLALENIDKG